MCAFRKHSNWDCAVSLEIAGKGGRGGWGGGGGGTQKANFSKWIFHPWATHKSQVLIRTRHQET